MMAHTSGCLSGWYGLHRGGVKARFTRTRVLANLFGEYEIIDNLNLKLTLTVNYKPPGLNYSDLYPFILSTLHQTELTQFGISRRL